MPIDGFEVTPFTVNHSAGDAYMLLIKVDGKTILHTGDFRDHGYYGEKIVILAQSLGLNTCWAGLTYKKVAGAFTLRDGDIIHCEISLGYGENQGVQHPQKPAEKFFEAEGEVPDWFKAGLEAALLAPTAVNQQKFKFILRDGNKVETKTFASLWGYTQIDLGIVKYHFEVAAGKENFQWL